MMYEKDESGEYISWGNDFYCLISSREYEDYKETYEYRYLNLRESRLEKTCLNYLDRRLLLQKFDDWMYEGEDYPWHWGFEEIKEKRHGRIRTAKQFINALDACTRFVADEYKKNPDYQPPDRSKVYVPSQKILGRGSALH
jgi:hypothetical protein